MTQSWNGNRRPKFAFAKLLAGACISACVLPASAQAFAIPDPIAFADSRPDICPVRQLEPAISAPSPRDAGTGKSAAILGGQVSALDLIRQQQSHLDADKPAVRPISIVPNFTTAGQDACLASSITIETPSAPTVAMPSAADEFLGSARIGIRRTPFSDEWQRVSANALSAATATNLLDAESRVNIETLSRVNRWANNNVEYADDVANYGVRDYWATASETLRSRQGDCEDFAILKYQLLASLGFDRSQMYLTLARDLVRNADHAVLIVRMGQRHYMLDNATDVLLPANVSYDYRPTISFSSESAWLHGASNRPRFASNTQPRNFAYLSDSAVSSALVTGLSR